MNIFTSFKQSGTRIWSTITELSYREFDYLINPNIILKNNIHIVSCHTWDKHRQKYFCNNTFVSVKDLPQPLVHPVSWVEVVAEALWQMKFFSVDHHYNAKILFFIIYFLKFLNLTIFVEGCTVKTMENILITGGIVTRKDSFQWTNLLFVNFFFLFTFAIF